MTPYYLHNFFKPYFYTKIWNVHYCQPVAVCNLDHYRQVVAIFKWISTTSVGTIIKWCLAQLPLTVLASDPQYTFACGCGCVHARPTWEFDQLYIQYMYVMRAAKLCTYFIFIAQLPWQQLHTSHDQFLLPVYMYLLFSHSIVPLLVEVSKVT